MATAQQKAAVLGSPPLTQLPALRLPRRMKLLAGLSAIAAAVAVAAGALAAPVPVLGALLTLALVAAVWSRPEVALGALLLFLPFNVAIFLALANKAGVHHTGPLGDWKDAVIVLLFLRGLDVRRRRDGELRLPRGAFPRFLIAYVLFYLLLTAASPALKPAIYELSRDIEGPLLFLAILCLRPSRRVIVGCVLVALAAAFVIGIAAVYEHLGPRAGFIEWYGAPPPGPNSSFLPGDGGWRSGSFLNSPLVLAFYLGVCAPVALGYAIAFRDRTRLALFAGLTSAACVAGILMTETRSGYLGGGIGLALVLLVGVRNRNVRIAVIGAFLIVATFALVQNQHSRAISRPGENASKQSAWLRDFDLITKNPLGFGLGTIDSVGQRFGNTADTAQSSESTLLAKGVEGGVPALLLYPASLLLLILFMLDRRRRALARGDEVGAGLAACGVGSAAAVLGCGLFLGIQELVVEVAVWIPPALAVAWGLAEPGTRAARPRSPGGTVQAPPLSSVRLAELPTLPSLAPIADLQPAPLGTSLLLLSQADSPPTPEPEPEPEPEREAQADSELKPDPGLRPERAPDPGPAAPAAQAETSWPFATVVLAAPAAPAAPGRIAASLRSLLELDYEEFEVLVISAGEPDPALAAVASTSSSDLAVQLISIEQAPPLVHGDVLAVLDPGARPRPAWLRAGVAALARPKAGTAIGHAVPCPPWGRGNRFFRTDVLRYADLLADAVDPERGAPVVQSMLEQAGWSTVRAAGAVVEFPEPASTPLWGRGPTREAQLLALAVGLGVTRRRPLVGVALTSAYVWSRRRRYGFGTRPRP